MSHRAALKAAGTPIFSHAIVSGNTVYLSGVIGSDKDGKIVEGSIKDRTQAALDRTSDRLATLGLDLSDGESGRPAKPALAGKLMGAVVSVQIWLSNYKQDFASMNEAYIKAFADYQPMPVRTCVGVAALPADTDIELTIVSLGIAIMVGRPHTLTL